VVQCSQALASCKSGVYMDIRVCDNIIFCVSVLVASGTTPPTPTILLYPPKSADEYECHVRPSHTRREQ
jgi:hypothetical protein